MSSQELDPLSLKIGRLDAHMAQVVEKISSLDTRLTDRIDALDRDLKTALDRLPQPGVGESVFLNATWKRWQVQLVYWGGVAISFLFASLLALAIWVAQDTWGHVHDTAEDLAAAREELAITGEALRHLDDTLAAFMAAGGRATALDLDVLAECVELRFTERAEGLEIGVPLVEADKTGKDLILGCIEDIGDLRKRLRGRQ